MNEKTINIFLIIDTKNAINIINRQVVRKDALIKVYEDQITAYNDMNRKYSVLNIDDFCLLEFSIKEKNYKTLRGNFNLKKFLNKAIFLNTVVFNQLNVKSDCMDLVAAEIRDDIEKKEISKFLNSRIEGLRD